jgi:methionyl-tRNA synthetase
MSEEGKGPLPPAPGTSPSAPPLPPQASLEDFKKLVFRVGVVTAAADHPNADRLLILTVDLGEGTPRQLVAGIKGTYQAPDLVGKRIVVVANLKPAVLRGVESQGMALAASDGQAVILVSPERPVPPGSLVK